MFEPLAESEREGHLAGLNRSFPGWGGSERLSWVLTPFGGHDPDAFVARGGERLVAGSIVSYRQVAAGSSIELVGIMTGSWVDEDQRGRGLFSHMIGHSADLARERGAVALLAFVTADNASRRRLEAAGSVMIPTAYVVTPAVQPWGWSVVDDVDSALAELDASRSVRDPSRCRFAYPSVADLRHQLIERSHDVVVLRSDSGSIAVVERAAGTLRVLAVARADDTPWVHGAKERFTFTASPADSAGEGGGRSIPGFLTALPLAVGYEAPTAWTIDSGDRI